MLKFTGEMHELENKLFSSDFPATDLYINHVADFHSFSSISVSFRHILYSHLSGHVAVNGRSKQYGLLSLGLDGITS